MSEVFPSSYYRDPANGAVDEMRFMESRWRREQTGCRGCRHSPDAGLSCDLERIPGSWGYCDEWAE